MRTDLLMSALAALLVLGITVPGCGDSGGSSLGLTMTLPVDRKPLQADLPESLVDPLGLFILPEATVFISLSLSAGDMDTVTRTWPESPEDLADLGSEVFLELEADPGTGRNLAGVVYLMKEDGPHCYEGAGSGPLTLTPGQLLETDLILSESEYRGFQGTAGEGVTEVGFADRETNVLLARFPLDEQGNFTAFHLPGGRPVDPVLYLSTGDEVRLTDQAVTPGSFTGLLVLNAPKTGGDR